MENKKGDASVAVPIPCFVGPIKLENTVVAIKMRVLAPAADQQLLGAKRLIYPVAQVI